jgi:hypothetical protein
MLYGSVASVPLKYDSFIRFLGQRNFHSFAKRTIPVVTSYHAEGTEARAAKEIHVRPMLLADFSSVYCAA